MNLCEGQKSGKVIIISSGEVIDNIPAPFTVTRGNINSWYVNPYVAYRPSDNCNISNWEGFFLNDSNPNSNYQFVPVSAPSSCGYPDYQISLNGGAPGGNLFHSIIPNGIIFRPWQCQIKIISNNQEIFKREYPLDECPQLKIECVKGCPDGFIECACLKYPGYCCLSCSEIKAELAALSAKVRGIK